MMSQIELRLAENIEGEFFVDSSCIDCDACRQIAPTVFRDHGGQSSVGRQPANPRELRRALMALVSCPTASIGTVSKRSAREGVDALPDPVVDDVYFCGFTSESSFGAWSYLITRPEKRGGNVLVDSPRFVSPLVKRIEQMGGLQFMFLTHRDDIADHAKFARHFGCPRVMHEDDGASRLGIEHVTSGSEEVQLDPELRLIPTPGHTRGHQVLLYRDKILFTGDHLSWSPERHALTGHPNHCWYNWREQTRSMERLLGYRFSWVLPGHGRMYAASSPEEMRELVARCVEEMKGR